MNTGLSAYTHLESLLLFQSLNAYGVGANIFSRISDLLKNNPTVTNDRRFQSGRLSPDALRNFYLQILKEEIKSEGQDGLLDGEAQNGEVKISRKRKAPTPPLPTVQEAAQHKHLIPQLVNKLYARYRTALTQEIRDEEDRYERLQRELESIERGERDGELYGRATAKSRSPSMPKKSPLLQQKPFPPPTPSPQPPTQDGSRTATPVLDGSRPLPTEDQRSLAPPNGQLPNDRVNKKTSPRKKHISTPSTPQPTPTNRTPQPPTFPPAVPANFGFNGPVQHAPQSSHPPPALQGPHLHGHTPQGMPPSMSPHAPTQSTQPHPPPGNLPPGASPFQTPPVPTYSGNGASPYGPPTVPGGQYSSGHQRFQDQQTATPHSPGMQTPQQQRNLAPQPLQPNQASYQHHQQMPQPPPHGGIMLPPFQVSPQDPARAQQQPSQPYAHASTPVSRPPSAIRPGGSAASAVHQSLPQLQPIGYPPRGAVYTPQGQRTPYSAVSTPLSAKSLWKSTFKNVPPSPAAPRPPVEELEMDDIESVGAKQSPPKAKPARKARGKGKAKDKEAEKAPVPEPEPAVEPDKPEEAVPEADSRPGRSLRNRRARRGSVTSSLAAGSVRARSRSQSIISHTETIAADTESQAGTRIKSERGTSVDVGDADSVGTPSGPRSRRRAGAAQTSQPRGRKRNQREASIEESPEHHTDMPPFPRFIAAPRGFSKGCVEALNDMASHKHGSLFKTAVKPKDAEGYHDIVRRPTDLSTIKKAVTAGAKAVSAAASDTPAGSPGGGGSMLQVPLSADVIPPKGIVNSGQLEKEVMRMFANAVMFNPGEDGVVEDAREMSEACQRTISNWRSAEQSNLKRMEIEETPVSTQEEEPPQASKRRKL